VIVGISTIKELKENVEIARNVAPLTPDEMARLEELTTPYFAEAIVFKTQW